MTLEMIDHMLTVNIHGEMINQLRPWSGIIGHALIIMNLDEQNHWHHHPLDKWTFSYVHLTAITK